MKLFIAITFTTIGVLTTLLILSLLIKGLMVVWGLA